MEFLAVEARQSAEGADPHAAVGVEVEGGDIVGGQAVLRGVVVELLAVEARQPAAHGA